MAPLCARPGAAPTHPGWPVWPPGVAADPPWGTLTARDERILLPPEGPQRVARRVARAHRGRSPRASVPRVPRGRARAADPRARAPRRADQRRPRPHERAEPAVGHGGLAADPDRGRAPHARRPAADAAPGARGAGAALQARRVRDPGHEPGDRRRAAPERRRGEVAPALAVPALRDRAPAPEPEALAAGRRGAAVGSAFHPRSVDSRPVGL